MTIPQESKLWLLYFPNHQHIVHDIVDLMENCAIAAHPSGLNATNSCVYIGKREYDMGLSKKIDGSSSPTDVFKTNNKKEISLEHLFPAPPEGQKVAIKVRSEAHSQVIQDVLHELGYSWMSGGKYSGFKDGVIVITPERKRITCAHDITQFTEIYYSQLLNIKHNGEQVKVQGKDQPESGCTGCSPIRFQSRSCKIAIGQRYTGYPAKYYHSGTRISISKIRGTVPESGYPGRFIKVEGFPGGLGPAPQVKGGALLSGLKRKYATGNSEVDF